MSLRTRVTYQGETSVEVVTADEARWVGRQLVLADWTLVVNRPRLVTTLRIRDTDLRRVEQVQHDRR